MTKPKIYIFLNATIADISTYAAVAEDGFALATLSVPLIHIPDEAWMKLGPQSKWIQNYEQHYPDGYELVNIQDIKAPEHAEFLERIRNVAAERADERREQYKLAQELIKSIEIRDLTDDEKTRLTVVN